MKYKNEVKVISGFYEGKTWILHSEHEGNEKILYWVIIDNQIRYIDKNYLELIK